MGFVRDERQAIVETMQRTGSEAPTLCEGWTVRDLAAHLVLRERRMDAAAGILVPPLAGYTARVQRGIARRGFGELLDCILQGPPWYSPMHYLDEKANLVEYFVHHEDVRRAQPQWEPRELPEQVQRALWRAAGMLGRRGYAKAPASVTLATPDGATARVVTGRGPEVTVRGLPGELVLHAFGRDAVRLEFDGPAEAVEAVRTMRRTFP